MAKVRLADIAKVAGVSAVTVHNAITGQKGVSDEMRARILEIAKEICTCIKHRCEAMYGCIRSRRCCCFPD